MEQGGKIYLLLIIKKSNCGSFQLVSPSVSFKYPRTHHLPLIVEPEALLPGLLAVGGPFPATENVLTLKVITLILTMICEKRMPKLTHLWNDKACHNCTETKNFAKVHSGYFPIRRKNTSISPLC